MVPFEICKEDALFGDYELTAHSCLKLFLNRFRMLTSAGQLISMILQIFSALSQATISGLLCYNFVAVLMARFHQNSQSLTL